jgi:hypothetical protein
VNPARLGVFLGLKSVLLHGLDDNFWRGWCMGGANNKFAVWGGVRYLWVLLGVATRCVVDLVWCFWGCSRTKTFENIPGSF